MVSLLVVGCIIFAAWAVLFFLTSKWQWLDIIHFIGFLYLLLSASLGIFTYALVLGTVAYKFKLFKKNTKFKTAFYKVSSLTLLSFALALGMAKFVSDSVNRLEIQVRNKSNKNIEKVIIAYAPEKTSLIHNLKIEQNERIAIFPGEGSLSVKIVFSDGSTAEQLVEGYVDQTINRTPFYRIDIGKKDIKILKIKK